VWASFVAKIQTPRPPTSALGFDESGSNVTIDEDMPLFLKADVIPQILDAGFNFDFIDADAINAVGIPYKVLVLPGVDRLSPEAYEKIVEFARRGGIVIATRRLPATAPGLSHAAEISARNQSLSRTLFHGQIATAHFVEDERDLGARLKQWAHPDFVTSSAVPEIGFIHRRLQYGELYFVANTSNRTQNVRASFRDTAAHAEMWDPFTGKASGLGDAKQIRLDLQPYESRIIFFSKKPLSPVPPEVRSQEKQTDISHDWSVSFEGDGHPAEMQTLTSWTDIPGRQYYSGRATYRKTIEIPAVDARPGHTVAIDFGRGTRVLPPTVSSDFSMRAYLESPVHEAAAVYVNDRLAGYVWHPPFCVDLTPYVKPGKNEIRIVVGNTAINELAGTAMPNYRLLYARYGKLFEPQGMANLQPVASGIVGQMNLIEGSPEQ
jgi:hypothetical protein